MTLSQLPPSRPAQLPALVPQARPPRIPLSSAQSRLWFLDRLESGGGEYHLIETMRVRGTLDRAALAHAVIAVVSRHESLRTRFVAQDGEPVQLVMPDAEPLWVDEDASGSGASALTAIEAAVQRELDTPFDLSRGPLLRFRVVRLAADDHVIVRTFHHIVADAWSESVFNDELSALYAAYHERRPDLLPPLAVQYADFALWQQALLRSAPVRDGVEYWTRQLADLPERARLPMDHARPARQTFSAGCVEVTIPQKLTARLRQAARAHHATAHMALLGALAVLLARYGDDDDVAIGVPIANRRDPRLEQLIGFFVNTLVMRVRVPAASTCAGLLRDVRRTALDAFTHQDVPFERVVEAVAPARTLSTSPLVQVMLLMQNAPARPLQLVGAAVERIWSETARVRYDLEVYAWPSNGRVDMAWLYNDRLFDRWRIEQMALHFTRVLEAFAEDAAQPVHSIPLLTSGERATVIAAGAVAPPTASPRPVVRRWLEARPSAADAPALICGGRSLTYEQLRRWRRRIGGAVRATAGGGHFAAILTGDRVVMAVAAGGALDGGCGFVPLDASLPDERLRVMLSRCSPSVVLTDPEWIDRVCAWSTATVLLLADCLADSRHDNEEWAPTDWSGRPAYLYFTSGSTGVPKPVAGRMAGLEHFVAWEIDACALGPEVRVSQLTPPGFDPYLRDIFVAWAAGGTVCIPSDPDVLLDATRLVQWLADERVTLVHCVPTLLRALLAVPDLGMRLPDVKYVLSAGEPLLPSDVQRWTATMGSDAQLINLYGPTETTLAKFAHRVAVDDAARAIVPVGRPLPGAAAVVLDRRGEVNPFGVVGEIAIATRYRTFGYYNAPAATAEAFVPHQHGAAGETIYRTGDLGRLLPDGRFECLGRRDRQVKIRGHRIELAEIEAVILEQPGVRQAAVVRRETPEGDASLVAYVAGDGDPRQWRAAVQRRLPSVMMPAAWIRLDRLPVTRHGKVDWRALLRTESTPTASPVDAPRAPHEDVLCALVADVVGAVDVELEDDFFALGGHSLMATRLLGRIKAAFGVDISLRELFETPRLCDIAQQIAKKPLLDSPLLCLRTAGNLTSLVCITRIAPGTAPPPYADLLRAVGRDHPVYIVDLERIDRGAAAGGPNDLVPECLALIRAAQPSGPYQLLGWRSGAEVAHGVACALRRAHECVGLLAAFDGDPPTATGTFDGDLVLFAAAERLTTMKQAWMPRVGGGVHARTLQPGSERALWSACAAELGSALSAAGAGTI